jgi:tetratricopeptide (TPR) repeat protein
LLVESKHSPPAMISMLEKLRASEKASEDSEEGFLEQMQQASQRDVNQALGVAYQKLVSGVSANHPKTAERIEDTAQYLERHYGNRQLPEPKPGPWKAVMDRPDVVQVMRNYKQAFSATRLLDQGQKQEAYAAARTAATGRTATDAYPNLMLAQSAEALGRQAEAVEALRRAAGSTEPVAPVYEELILTQERAGHVAVALDWADRASNTFGGSPRWTPHKIRLLRKAGRVAEASTLAITCSVSTPDLKRPCQEANQTPAGRAQR